MIVVAVVALVVVIAVAVVAVVVVCQYGSLVQESLLYFVFFVDCMS